MNVVDLARILAEEFPDAVVVSSLGTSTAATREATADGPHFYFGAAMGCALAGAIGLAEAVPENQVVALLGDGDFLMGASSLWSLSSCRPPNLLVVVAVDEAYFITGGQPIAAELRLSLVANALPGLSGCVAETPDGLRESLRTVEQPGVVEARIAERVQPGPSPFVDPPTVVRRLRERLALPQ